MARRKNNITTASGRRILPYRNSPYWLAIAPGLSVGYRQSSLYPEGTWYAQKRVLPSGEQVRMRIGRLPRSPAPEDATTDVFFEAVRLTLEWSKSLDGDSGAVEKSPPEAVEIPHYTVLDATNHYVLVGLRGRPKAQARAEASFKYRVFGHRISRITLDTLRKKDLIDWMSDCADQSLKRSQGGVSDSEKLRRARESANRDFRHLRAALNHAHTHELCSTKAAWSGQVAFRGTSKGRDTYLSNEEMDRWLSHIPHPLHSFIEGPRETGARPAELADAVAGDLNLTVSSLRLKTGKRREDQATTFRMVPLSNSGIAKFKAFTRDRQPDEHIFVDRDGAPWTKATWSECAKYAKKAGLPARTTAYSIRHATLSRWIAGGLSIFEAAKLGGTSVEMIQKHYGHILPEVTRAKLNAAEEKTAND